ncbi:MAG: S41 family peptidase [Chitinophagales bacterium]|nr:S41 family peptidase [Chitinophagales bacterium]MDW8418026.1 S41 family peptidase [Chitinophagales bacterium]
MYGSKRFPEAVTYNTGIFIFSCPDMNIVIKPVSAVILFFVCTMIFAQNGDAIKRKYTPADKFVEVINLINNYYTDTVNDEKLVEDAIRKVLEDLDPHSTYVPAKDVKRSEESLVGNFEGIGITFQILKDTVMVLEVIPGGPSEKVGLQAGDKIIKANDTLISGVKIDNEGVIKKLRGPKDTKVKILVLRKGERAPLEFTITRGKIPIYSITAYYMAAPEVGYIRLERFSATTMTEFFTALNKLQEQGMKDLIVDLQGNVGGYLYTAVDMCNQFLQEKELIVYTQGVHSPYYPYYSDGKGLMKNGKLVVMVDESSASAAEIFSGCMQDNDRGLVVGRRTFGKGLVQKPFTLSDGSQIKLTTAHYYTPSGRCIQKPYGQGNKEYRSDYQGRLMSGELYGVDTFHYPDSLLRYTKVGRKVYGGGGVMPDYFVPIDTSMNSPLFNLLVRSGVENRFCLEYVDKYRSELMAKYPNADTFFYRFEADTTLLAAYLAASVADSAIKLKPGINPQSFWQYFGAVQNDSIINFERDFTRSEKLIKARLKANIGRNLFDTGIWYRVINNSVNNVYAKALEVITNPRYFDQLKPKEDIKEKSSPSKPKRKVKVTTATKK